MDGSYWSKTLQSRMTRRRALASAAALGAGTALLAACGGGESGGALRDTSGLLYTPTDNTKDAVKGGIWQGAYAVEQLHFDPLSTNSQFTFGHAGHVYQRFFRLKGGTIKEAPSGEPEGDAVTSWEFSPDGLQLTMKLRPNNKWDARPPTNSRVMTTEDVKWSWDRFLTLQPARTFFSNQLHPDAPITSTTYPDASTIVMKLAFPMGALLKMFGTTFYFYILPIEADGKFDSRNDMRGTGAWMLTKYERGVGWEYRRNPNWFMAAERPFFDGIEYALIPDFAQRGPTTLAQFKAKRLSWLDPAPADLVLTLKREQMELNMFPNSPFVGNGSQNYVGMSKLPDSDWEKDVRLRQALSMVIDRELYIDVFGNVSNFRREGLPIEWGVNSHVPCSWPNVWLDPRSRDFGPNAKYLGWDPAAGSSILNDQEKRMEYNRNEAAKLLRAAGKFGKEETITYAAQGQFGTPKQIEVLTEMWNTGGLFRIKQNPQDYTTIITPQYTFGKGQYPDLGTHPLGGWSDWDIALWNTFSPSGRNDYVGHDTPHLKEIMVRHRQELDPKKRIEIAHEWQRAVAKEMVIVPFPGNSTTFGLAWPWIRNIGYFQTAGGSTAAQETWIHYWYDKSKDSRGA